MFKSKLLYLTTVVLSVMLFSNIANAQQVTLDTYNESDAQEESNGVVDFIPLMQKQVKAIGAVPPKPFFVAPMFFYLNESRNVSNVKASLLFGGGAPQPVDNMSMKSVNSETFSTGIRGGFWLFPFLSIYGMYAYTEGTTNFEIDSSKVDESLQNYIKVIDTTTNITVHTGGVGITAAYGMKDVFFKSDVFSNIDVNSSWSKVNLLDDLLYTITVSMRAGVSKNFAKHFRTSVWVGGMFRGGSSTGTKVGGEYPVIPGIKALYTADQSALSPWSMVAGLQIGISRYFDIITEFGFLNRFQANVNISFNF